MTSEAALDGVRVIDLASVGPGARATRILADYGASVVKLAPTPTHSGVVVTPPPHAYSGHRGMRRVRINLKSDEGHAAFLALLGEADVIVESFRPGVVDRLGIGYEQARAVNNQIVYCSTSGFGQTGPRRRWAGHDLNYLAVSGFLHCSGRSADGTPALPGATVADIAAGGMHAAMAIMAALLRRQRTGTGEYLDVSVADGCLAMMALYVDEHLATGTVPGPGHDILTGRYACYDIYECADGRYISVAAIEPAFWRNLCDALGLQDYIDHQIDDTRQNEIHAALAARFVTENRDEWVRRLAPADCCVAPVNSVVEAASDAHYKDRGLITEAVHPEAGTLAQLAPVWAGTVTPDRPYRLPHPDNTDTADMLSRLGYDRDRLIKLADTGVIA